MLQNSSDEDDNNNFNIDYRIPSLIKNVSEGPSSNRKSKDIVNTYSYSYGFGDSSVFKVVENDVKLVKEKRKQEAEEMNLLQLYVFVARCIAYPFTAKYRYDIIHKPPKLTNLQLMLARERFASFLNGDLKLPTDEAFTKVITKYNEIILKSEEVTNVVNGPGWSMTDFLDLFKKDITQQIAILPEIKGLSKSTLIENWMDKFEFLFRGESDNKKIFVNLNTVLKSITTKMNRDQLFDLFQKILGIKKQQHWTLFKLLQVDNVDEQAAQVRRELDFRMNEVKKHQKNANGNDNGMDNCYSEELKLSIESLKVSLQNVPVFRDESNKELSRFKMIAEDEIVSKNDVALLFKVQVVIKDLQGFVPDKKDRLIFCLFEMDGCDKLSTNRVDPMNMSWDDQADFVTDCPLPSLRIKLCRESSGVFDINDKELARVTLTLKLSNTPMPAEWYEMQHVYKKQTPKKNKMQIKILTHMEKPQNVKHFGYLFASGKTVWKKWKRRYFLLIQVSQFTFMLCSYAENKPQPTTMLSLNGFIVDFCGGVQGTDAKNSYFVLLKERFDEVIFTSSGKDSDLMPWLEAIYRATGQTSKPQLPLEAEKQDAAVFRSESQRMKKKKLQTMVEACSSKFNHEELFTILQKRTIEYRLSDPHICSSGWLSADQMYILDEYCARYGVRVFTRHLAYIEVLMDHAYSNISIDPSLLYQKFAFCVAHVHGNKLDQTYTATKEEKTKFLCVAKKLRDFLEYQFIHFRTCFPFGRPKDALKISLSLYESITREVVYFEELVQSDVVEVKQSLDPVPIEQMGNELKRCISNSTYYDYIHIAQKCDIEKVLYSKNFKRLSDSFTSLAEHCISIQQQILQYHADAFISYKDILTENAELLWSMYMLDLHQFTDKQPLTELLWNLFSLFHLLNEYFLSQSYLNLGESHKELCKIFAPVVLHYLESMHLSIIQSLHCNFNTESWKVVGESCSTTESILWKLDSIRNFIHDLNWPVIQFNEHLLEVLHKMTVDIMSQTYTRLSTFSFKILKKLDNENLCINSDIYFLLINTMNKIINVFSSYPEITQPYEKHLKDILDWAFSKALDRLKVLMNKLGRYDSKSLLSQFYILKKPSNDMSKSYTDFLEQCIFQMKKSIIDKKLLSNNLELFYSKHVEILMYWLVERIDVKLHIFQTNILNELWNKIIQIFKNSSLPLNALQTKDFQTISMRLEAEGTHSSNKHLVEKTVHGEE